MIEGQAKPEGSGAVDVSATTAITDELARLRSERDAALEELSSYKRRGRRGLGVAVLIVVFAILLPITTTATWAHRSVLNTEAWVRAVAPIAADPVVTTALSTQITDQLYAALDPEPRIAAVLPPEAAFLAGPIASGMKNTLQSGVNRIIESEGFQQLWATANRFAHAQLVAVLRGDSAVLQTSDDQVVLNLAPLVAEVVGQVEQLIAGVIGRPVTLAAINGDESPSALCSRIASALGRPVPSTCGQIALFRVDELSSAQQMVWAFDRLTPALLIATLLMPVVTLWLSRQRRRTVLHLAIAGALAVVVGRRLVVLTEDELISAAQPENRAVRAAVLRHVLDGYFGVTGWLLVGAMVVSAVALLFGPYRWAVATRTAAAAGAKEVRRLLSVRDGPEDTRASDPRAVAWVRRHLEVMQAAGVVVAVLLLLLFEVTFWWVVLVVVLVGAYELWLVRMGASSPAVEGSPGLGHAMTDAPIKDA